MWEEFRECWWVYFYAEDCMFCVYIFRIKDMVRVIRKLKIIVRRIIMSGVGNWEIVRRRLRIYREIVRRRLRMYRDCVMKKIGLLIIEELVITYKDKKRLRKINNT